MSYEVRYTKGAKDDLIRLFSFLLIKDRQTAHRAREAIGKAMECIADFPFAYRKADPDKPFLREMLIPFGPSGYVALFEIKNEATVTILVLRHQLEEDYY